MTFLMNYDLYNDSNVKHYCSCDEKFFVIDEQSGDIICSNCGIVKDERIMSYQESYDEDDNMIIQENSKDEYFENKVIATIISKPMGLMTKIHTQQNVNQKQLYRSKDFDEIDRLCENLNTTEHIAKDAKHFFNELCAKKLYRGPNRKAMMACCIMQSLGNNGVIRDISEVCSACLIHKNLLTKTISLYEKQQKTKIIREDISSEVYRYLQKMNIPTNDIYSLSNRIIKQQQDMMKQSIYQGKSPKILIAIILKKMNFEKKLICDGLKVSITAF